MVLSAKALFTCITSCQFRRRGRRSSIRLVTLFPFVRIATRCFTPVGRRCFLIRFVGCLRSDESSRNPAGDCFRWIADFLAPARHGELRV